MKPTEIPSAIECYCEKLTKGDTSHHRFASRKLQLGRSRGWFLIVKVRSEEGRMIETPFVLVEPVVGMVFSALGSGPEIQTGIAVGFLRDLLLEKASFA